MSLSAGLHQLLDTPILCLLALTGDKKYRPIAQRYFNHPDETIQNYAHSAYERMRFDLPFPELPEHPHKDEDEN